MPKFDPDPVQENLATAKSVVTQFGTNLGVPSPCNCQWSASKKFKQGYELNISGSPSKISLSLKLFCVPTLLIAHTLPRTCASLRTVQSTHRAHTREAPTVSPKSLLISGAKNEPSGHGEVLLLK